LGSSKEEDDLRHRGPSSPVRGLFGVTQGRRRSYAQVADRPALCADRPVRRREGVAPVLRSRTVRPCARIVRCNAGKVSLLRSGR
jgi:hypothetical protein